MQAYPFVEGVPEQVGGLQFMFQGLSVSVFGCTLDKTLTHSVDMLQFGLNAVYLLPFYGLKSEWKRERTKYLSILLYTCSATGHVIW